MPNKVHRLILAKLRGDTAPFRIEAGRWRGLAREERICMHCSLGEVEDVYHWMMRCTAWTESRTQLIEEVNCMIDVPNLTDEEVADDVLDRACTTCQLRKSIEGMWSKRFEERLFRTCHSNYRLHVIVVLVCACDSATLDHVGPNVARH